LGVFFVHNPPSQVPFGLLSEGKEAIDAGPIIFTESTKWEFFWGIRKSHELFVALVSFETAKKADKVNEALPSVHFSA